jgi:hypothetical protein
MTRKQSFQRLVHEQRTRGQLDCARHDAKPSVAVTVASQQQQADRVSMGVGSAIVHMYHGTSLVRGTLPRG